MSKKLVAYFSASGVTAKVAERLAAATGADLFEIRPEPLYTEADLDWRDKSSRSTLEMQDPAARPAMAVPTPDVAQYDAVFVGFPIWWYTAPRIVQTFLEGGDFSGKLVVPFATSGSSGLGNTVEDLRGSCAADTRFDEGKLCNGLSDEALAAWAQQF